MQWGPETQPLVEGPQAWLSSGGRRGKEELGWTESTRFGTCTTPPPITGTPSGSSPSKIALPSLAGCTTQVRHQICPEHSAWFIWGAGLCHLGPTPCREKEVESVRPVPLR